MLAVVALSYEEEAEITQEVSTNINRLHASFPSFSLGILYMTVDKGANC